MFTSILSLPPELVEQIVIRLQCPDVCQLRLTCRTLNEKTIPGQFKEFYRSRCVNLTNEDLERFIEVTKPGWMGCLLRNLTINGVMYDTDSLRRLTARQPPEVNNLRPSEPSTPTIKLLEQEELLEARSDLALLETLEQECALERQTTSRMDLLTRAFKQLYRHGSGRWLESIRLRVIVYAKPKERKRSKESLTRRINYTTADTLEVVLGALSQSELRATSFDAFYDDRRCSVESKVIAAALRGLALNPFFAEIKRMALGVSTNVHTYMGNRDTRTNNEGSQEWLNDIARWPRDEKRITGAADLLSKTPALQQLDLHFLSFHSTDANQASHDLHPLSISRNSWLFDRIVNHVSLPQLQRCSIGGATVSVGSFCDLLKKAPALERLELDNIRTAYGGKWERIFDILTSHDTKISYLMLDDLRQGPGPRLLHFDAPGDPKFSYHHQASETLGPSMITRIGREAVCQPLKYNLTRAQPLTNAQYLGWEWAQRDKYGPFWMDRRPSI
ncbi:MAG: hypothetical protein M1820_004092 [Bogoriella megaspora]|nr:MAG: hypothetical protein M1820_004092 [Bogoriella megaspora]